MVTATTIFALVLVVAAVIQYVFALQFWRYFRKLTSVRANTNCDAKVAILMCVRGCDPSLSRGLKHILAQNYSEYQVHLVVDSQTDTAWRVAHQVKLEVDHRNRLYIHELQHRAGTCGLKCSALIQGLEALDPNTTYVLLTDSDVSTHRFWIADLVGPLEADAQVGLVMGGQWFEPAARSTWGALVRSSWNAGAIVPTIVFQNPWAGTIAMRMDDIRKGNFAATWRTSMVDDGPLKAMICKLGRKLQFAPSLIMVNDENCTFNYAHRWVARMLTWSRLYEKNFFLSVIHAWFSNTVMVGLFGLLGLSLASCNWLAALIGAAGLIISGMLSVAAYLTSRKAVQRSCELSDRELAAVSPVRLVKLFFAVPLTQLVYWYASIKSCFTKRINWREISYEIKDKDNIRMIAYQPFCQTQEQIEAQTSI
jgi:glycosyltransferase involved in cell wall biosynthesis